MSLWDAIARFNVARRERDGYWRLRYLRGNPPGKMKPVYRWVWPVALLLLTACATTPHTVALKPPAELTEPVAEPVLADKPTNGDLAAFADALRDALREANRRLRVIRGL